MDNNSLSTVGTQSFYPDTEDQLNQLALNTAYKVGEEFFAEVVCALSEILNVRHVSIGECLGQRYRVRTLAFSSDNSLCKNFEYDVKGTPCQAVMDSGSYFCPQQIQKHFPDDADLADLNGESYGGISLFDSQGVLVGLLCFVHDESIADSTWQLPTLKLIQARCGAEIERIRIERIRAYEQKVLENTQKLAALGTLAAGIAHEINNPLTSIQLSAELVKHDLKEDARQIDNINLILDSVKSISQIVDGVLRTSSNQESEKTTCDLAGVLHRAIDLTSHMIDEKTLIIELNTNPCFVLANPLELQQVFVNLISNAIQSTTEPEQTIEVSIESSPTEHIIAVENEGAEITAEEQQKIFDPFYSTRRAEGGTGLGLSVSLEIARAHGGDITVKSNAEKTSFYVRLPICDGWPSENCDS